MGAVAATGTTKAKIQSFGGRARAGVGGVKPRPVQRDSRSASCLHDLATRTTRGELRERLVDKTFDDAVVLCFQAEVESQLPWDPKERSMVPDPVECPQCWRDTLIAQEWDAWGIEVGEGVCIACGYERTYEDTVTAAMDRVMRDGC